MDDSRPKQASGRATIKDVARAAGVSAMTVSNVLNGRTQFVSPATRKRVEREIARLNYRRQANARNLRVAEQRSIGMVVVDPSPFFLADYFTCQVVAGLANVLNQADYTLTLQGMRIDQLANSMIMRSFEVGGFCAMISGPAAERGKIVDSFRRLQQPFVLFQEALDKPLEDVCVVRQDDRAGGRLLADHLLARRVKTYLAIVPRQDWPAVEYRLAGLREGLAADPSASLAVIESADESFSAVQTSLARHLETAALPGAVFGANDSIATAALLLLLDRGHRVPDDVRVVGFNGFEAHRYSRPKLTTVISAPYSLGERAGHAMLQRLRTGRFELAEHVLPVVFSPSQTS
jgi:DNA-binding LacI/PurR family transcriptional regulator